VIPVQDCRVISRWVDGFLLVVAAHRTPRRLVQEALSVIEPSKLIGFVFNEDDALSSGRYAGYYRGYYSASATSRNGHPAREKTGLMKRMAGLLRPHRHQTSG
jgi:Mrp family chromosome partitioning ATPase